MSFQHKVVVVTGAARGIGLAAARGFAAEGARVVITDFAPPDVEAAAAQLRSAGAEVLGLHGDVADEARVQAHVTQILQHFGHIDVLVCNAGIMARCPLEDMPTESWRKLMSVNLDGVFFWTREVAARSMIPRRSGAIVNVASQAGLVGVPFAAGYVASKHAVVGLTKAQSIEWGRYGIRVNALCPGMTLTDLSREHRQRNPAMFEERERRIPLGYPATPEHQADAILYLASDKAASVHGLIMNVDGGNLALSSGHSAPRA